MARPDASIASSPGPRAARYEVPRCPIRANRRTNRKGNTEPVGEPPCTAASPARFPDRCESQPGSRRSPADSSPVESLTRREVDLEPHGLARAGGLDAPPLGQFLHHLQPAAAVFIRFPPAK